MLCQRANAVCSMRCAKSDLDCGLYLYKFAPLFQLSAQQPTLLQSEERSLGAPMQAASSAFCVQSEELQVQGVEIIFAATLQVLTRSL